MSWTNVKLIYLRELRDQLRDRRTLFTIAILPLLLYPLLGMSVFQVQQFLKEHASTVRIVGAENLPAQPPLLTASRLHDDVATSDQQRLVQVEVVPAGTASRWSDASRAALQADAQRAIAAGECDAVVVFPADFAQRLAQFRRTARQEPHSPGDPRPPEDVAQIAEKVPQPLIFLDTASEKSKVARDRVDA